MILHRRKDLVSYWSLWATILIVIRTTPTFSPKFLRILFHRLHGRQQHQHRHPGLQVGRSGHCQGKSNDWTERFTLKLSLVGLTYLELELNFTIEICCIWSDCKFSTRLPMDPWEGQVFGSGRCVTSFVEIKTTSREDATTIRQKSLIKQPKYFNSPKDQLVKCSTRQK